MADSIRGAAVKIRVRRELSPGVITRRKDGKREMKASFRLLALVLQKLEKFSRTRIGLRVDLFGFLPAKKRLEGNTKDDRHDLKLINIYETGSPSIIPVGYRQLHHVSVLKGRH